MTDFFTHCSKKHRLDCAMVRHWLRGWLRWCLAVWLVWGLPGQAQIPAGIPEMQLEWTEEGVFLSAALQFELPKLAEDALHKGIPMYFVTEAELVRDRWYWYDQHIETTARYMRLSYQPLTRRWRLNVSPVPFEGSGLGVVFGQNFDALPDVLATMQRIARWKIAEYQAIDPQGRYNVNLRFWLDMSQLPRPLQIGAMGRSGWNLSMARNQRLAMELAR
ncbi:MAG: DUF4390 domain-containing protein [Flavobacteriales bacterium]